MVTDKTDVMINYKTISYKKKLKSLEGEALKNKDVFFTEHRKQFKKKKKKKTELENITWMS